VTLRARWYGRAALDLHDGYGRPPERRERTLSRRALFGLKRGALARADLGYDEEAARRREAWSALGEAQLRALGPVAEVVAALAAPQAGDRVLDPAGCDGDVALACARGGASVDACEDTAAMAARGRGRTGGAVRWSVAPVTDLPYDDGDFDTVVSAFGIASAPRARRAAAELARVLRPGGRLVMAAWSPRGLPGALDQEVPQREGIPAPSSWADPERAAARLAEHFEHVVRRTRTVVLASASADAMFAALTAPYALPDAMAERLRPRFDALLRAQNDVPGAVRISARYVVLEARRRA